MKILALILAFASMTSVSFADQKFGNTGEGMDCRGKNGNFFYRAFVVYKNYRRSYDVKIWKQQSAFTGQDYSRMANGSLRPIFLASGLERQLIPGGSSAKIDGLIYLNEVDLAAIDSNRAGNQAKIDFLSENRTWEKIELYCSGVRIPGR